MLKITTRIDPEAATLELEGRLAGPWVEELRRSWEQAVIPGRPTRIMLKAVMFIDEAGKKLLAEMHRKGAELATEECKGCMTRAIVEEIVRGGRP